MQRRLATMFAATFCGTLLLSMSKSAQGRTIDEYWPYSNPPPTVFQNFISPGAADVTFVMNGRPVTYSKPQTDFADLQKRILKAFDDAHEMEVTTSHPVIVSTEPLSYLKQVKSTVASLANPALKISVGVDTVQVAYSPPPQKIGSQDIILYDALSSASVRQADYDGARSIMMKSLERKKTIYGVQSDQVIEQLRDIATMFEDEHDYRMAGKFYTKAYETSVAAHGENTKQAASILTQLARIYDNLGRLSDGTSTVQRARVVMQKLGIETVARPISEGIGGARNSGKAPLQDVSQVISFINQSNSRSKADIEARRQTLYSMIHQDEIARAKAAEAERKRRIRADNEKLLKNFPNLIGVKFTNILMDLPAFLTFHNDNQVDIEPYYSRHDAKDVPVINGSWNAENAADDPDNPEWHIRVQSQYQGTGRMDEWSLEPSNEEIGVLKLNQVNVQDPYPKYLKGRLKLKSLPTSLDNKNLKSGLVPPPPPTTAP